MIHYRSADMGGHRVFYREAGEPRNPAVLLLHGFPTSWASGCWAGAFLLSFLAAQSWTTTIFPLASFASMTRCASWMSSNRNTRVGFAL